MHYPLAGDGFLSPAEVVNRAHRNGVKVLALTDHDTMAGVPLALKAAQEHRIRLIPGVEISAKFGSRLARELGIDEVVMRNGMQFPAVARAGGACAYPSILQLLWSCSLQRDGGNSTSNS
jgi:DNA polymerase III alpha subunit